MKLAIQNGSVTINGNTILERVDFEVNDSEHIAVVGRNGSGKTTLLKAIIDNELFDEGTGEEKFLINRIGNFQIGYQEQIEFNENVSLKDELYSCFKNIIDLENKINRLTKQMEDIHSDKIIDEYTNALESYKLLGGYQYQKEIEVMLYKFGFKTDDKFKKMSEFSGGEKTKLAFIKLLLLKPDLLILDEPTNHLDISTIEWLEEYLKSYKGAIILVSHDRMFIDNIANIIYDIDYGETIRYKSNYTNYVKLKEERYNKLLKDYNAQQNEIKRLNDIYLRFRFKPTKAKMALSRLKKIEQMDIIDKPNKIDTKTFQVNLSNIPDSSKIVLKADKVSFGYDNILGTISLEIKKGTKIGIIGANGTGKSTLLKTLNGELTPLSGTITNGLHVKCGYFDQNLKPMTNGSVLTEFRTYLPILEEEQARRALGSFLFKGDDVNKDINVLSGGEKVRLSLCKILYNKPNLLLLDEPTNHLDIVGKTHLEHILKEYPGTIIFVSHDRYFVKEIADELIVFEDNKINHYKYGYQEYLNNRKGIEIIEEKKHVQDKKITIVEKIDYKKELTKIENVIININNRINKLTNELYNENVYSDIDKASSLAKKINDLKEELKLKEEEWEDITNKILNN